MDVTVGFEESVQIGEKNVLDSVSPTTTYAVVFEDDGETGYFYGLDTARGEQQILDALHIYNVDSVVDKSKPSVVQAVWSQDGAKAALLINGYPHAAFDFDAKRGWCRTGFPEPRGDWSREGHEWDDTAMDLFT